MILGVGTDIVKVDRFKSWSTLNKEKLLHIFSEQEFSFCFKKNNLDLQCLASRFAAKEAFYKALSSSLIKLNLNKKDFYFFFSCKNVEILKEEWGVPTLKINWSAFEKKLGIKIPSLNINLSISHEKKYAIAFVVISE